MVSNSPKTVSTPVSTGTLRPTTKQLGTMKRVEQFRLPVRRHIRPLRIHREAAPTTLKVRDIRHRVRPEQKAWVEALLLHPCFRRTWHTIFPCNIPAVSSNY